MVKTALFPRYLESSLRDALADTPVLVVVGARQTGKSTLVKRLLGPTFKADYITFDDVTARAAAHADPAGFLAGYAGPLVLDEVQHVPELFPQIKLRVDSHRRPGMYVLTGSANVLLLSKISESLAGRSEHFALWPLSQGELAGKREGFIDALFADRLRTVEENADIRRDVLRRALRGGYPEILRRSRPDRRTAWFRAYTTAILQRDVRELTQIAQPQDLTRLLTIIAARVGSPLNVLDVSRSLDIPHMTVRRYLTILERLFFLHQVPGWSGGLNARVTQHPKAYLPDSGLLAHLMGVDVTRFQKDPTLSGALIENFVVGEIERQRSWNTTAVTMYHFRTTANEVDVVLERPDGMLVGVEVKAASSVGDADLGGLRALAARAGIKFHRGIVLYSGARTVAFAKNLHAMPISGLWRL
jgi:predicted AAA+ superfamily ATPase